MRYTREQIEALSVQFFETRLKEVVPVIRTVDLLQTNGDLQGIFLITDFTITNTMPFPRFIIGDNSKRTFFAQAVSSESPDLNC